MGCWVWMGGGCPCPPVRNDIVTPRHLFKFTNHSWICLSVYKLVRLSFHPLNWRTCPHLSASIVLLDITVPVHSRSIVRTLHLDLSSPHLFACSLEWVDLQLATRLSRDILGLFRILNLRVYRVLTFFWCLAVTER